MAIKKALLDEPAAMVSGRRQLNQLPVRHEQWSY